MREHHQNVTNPGHSFTILIAPVKQPKRQKRRSTTVLAATVGIWFFCVLTMFAQPNITQWGYSIPVVPADVTNAVSLAGSTSSSLALRPNGTVRAWGNWAAMTNVPTGLSNVVMIAYRDFQNLILKSDGTIASWGSSTFTNIPAGITNIVAICAGYDHSLALRSDGTCLTLNAPLNNPMIVPSAVSNIVGVAAGQSFSLVVLANTRLLAYGPISAPTNLDRVVSVASGYRHALALRDDGTVVAFGENASGQCNVPAGLSNVISIAAGYSHSMALQSDGTVVSWGDLPSPTNLINVVAIAAGNDFGTAISGVGEPFIVTALQNRSAYVGERTGFYALASGSWPLSYQWQLNGTNIPGATSNTLVIPAVFASDAGEYSVIVTNPYGSRVISAQLAVIDFDPAVGTTNLNWSSFGVTPWAIETNIFRTGPSALVSG